MYLYDDALEEKIKLWTQDTNMTVLGTSTSNRLFEIIADEGRDKVKLPIVAISIQSEQLSNSNKQPLSYDGKTIECNYDASLELNAIPIQLSYAIDVYARSYKECDEYIRNLIFNFVNFPTLDVHIPYKGKDLIHQSVIKLDPSISDVSSLVSGSLLSKNLTRKQLSINISDAYIWDVRVTENYKLVAYDVDAIDER